MELVALALIAVVVLAVAIDALRRRGGQLPPGPRDPAQITTQKIRVDLSNRR
jgi:hypothetical protein